MEIDDAVRRVKFIGRVSKAADLRYGYLTPPVQPRQAAGQANEHVSFINYINPLLKGAVAGELLAAVGNMVIDKPLSVHAIAVHAKDIEKFGSGIISYKFLTYELP